MTRLRIAGLFALLVVFLTAAACPVAPRPPTPHSHALNPPPISISAEGTKIVSLINEQRVAAGCEAVAVNDTMVAFADDHASWMNNGGGLVHSRLGAPILAENLSQGYTDPQEIVDAWMDSVAHRENILNCSYTDTGVALSGAFAVQVFGDAA